MENKQYYVDDFSLTGGGFINRVLVKLHFDHHRWKLALVLLCLTWLPLVIFTAINGTLFSGTRMSFLKDFTMHGRLLLAIPLFILIKNSVYSKTALVLQYISEVLIPDEDQEQFIKGPLQKAKQRSDSVWLEIILLVVVAGVAMSPIKGATLLSDRSEAGSWLLSATEGNQVLSFAGNWVRFISIPVFQFLLLRWLWRYITWILLLYRISKMKLNLQPTHPDGSGGLGIIMLAQRNFIWLFVVLSIVISSVFVARIDSNNSSFDSIKVEIIGFIILCIFLMTFPLFFFTGKLIRTKYQGLLDLSKAGTNLSKKFEGDWVKPLRLEERIGENTVDPSMHYDYYGLYILLQDLHILPIRIGDVINMALFLFVPFIPIFFIHYSIVELLQKIMGLLM